MLYFQFYGTMAQYYGVQEVPFGKYASSKDSSSNKRAIDWQASVPHKFGSPEAKRVATMKLQRILFAVALLAQCSVVASTTNESDLAQCEEHCHYGQTCVDDKCVGECTQDIHCDEEDGETCVENTCSLTCNSDGEVQPS